MKNIIYDTKLSLTRFLLIVDGIADAYFDNDGVYQPQYGLINAMRLFYCFCVTGGKFEGKVPHDTSKLTEAKEFLCDKDFCKAFNSAITNANCELDFANAYKSAKEIVEYKKSTNGSLQETIKNLVDKLLGGLGEFMTEDNLNLIATIGQKISEGEFGADALVDAYSKYQGFNNKVDEG